MDFVEFRLAQSLVPFTTVFTVFAGRLNLASLPRAATVHRRLIVRRHQATPAPRSAAGLLAAEGRLILFGGVGDSGKQAGWLSLRVFSCLSDSDPVYCSRATGSLTICIRDQS
jgi:hypothetical protein